MRRLRALVLLVVAGCGYGFAGTALLPEGARTVSVRVFRNQTGEFGAEVRLRQAIEDEFRRRGILRPVPGDDGDLILTGEIRLFTSVPVASDATDAALQYQSVMRVSIRFVERASKRVIYENKVLQQAQDFGAVNAVVITSSPHFQRGTINGRDLANMTSAQIGEARRRDATATLIAQIAREIYLQAMESF